MRKRSCTIYAESVEEYTALATQPTNKPSNSKPSLAKRDYMQEESSQNTGFWEDFDFQDNKAPSKDSLFIERSESFDQHRISDAETDCTESSPKKQRELMVKRFMVLGAREAQSYQLIDSAFKSGDDMNLMPMSGQVMDLIVKKEEQEGLQCQFWLKALEDNRFGSLVKVYYSSASTFVFVYSVSSRNSFDMVEQAIQEVLREVPIGQFVGVLLGNTGECQDNREVCYEEGAALQNKYGLALFSETNENDVNLKEKILNPYGLLF